MDILAHFEVCELGPTGQYVPVPVNHSEAQHCGGVFMVQQGVQRRIRMTLMYESGSEIQWAKVNELVIGKLTAVMIRLVCNLSCILSVCRPGSDRVRVFVSL